MLKPGIAAARATKVLVLAGGPIGPAADRLVHAAAHAQVRAVHVGMPVGEHVRVVPGGQRAVATARRRDERCRAPGRRPGRRARPCPRATRRAPANRRRCSPARSLRLDRRCAARASAPARRAAPTRRAEITTVSTPAAAAMRALSSVHESSTTTMRARTAAACARSSSARLRRSAARQPRQQRLLVRDRDDGRDRPDQLDYSFGLRQPSGRRPTRHRAGNRLRRAARCGASGPGRASSAWCTASAVCGWSGAGRRQWQATSTPSRVERAARDDRPARRGRCSSKPTSLSTMRSNRPGGHSSGIRPCSISDAGRCAANRLRMCATADAAPSHATTSAHRCGEQRGQLAGRAARFEGAGEPFARQAGQQDRPLAPLVEAIGQPPRVVGRGVQLVEVRGRRGGRRVGHHERLGVAIEVRHARAAGRSPRLRAHPTAPSAATRALRSQRASPPAPRRRVRGAPCVPRAGRRGVPQCQAQIGYCQCVTPDRPASRSATAAPHASWSG